MPARLSIAIRGAVQGVGFRPFVFRLASELRLNGWVSNTPQGVFIEAEGEKEVLDRFLLRLQNERPPRAAIQSIEPSFLDAKGYESFTIRESSATGSKTTIVLPDIAPCPDCLQEMFDPQNRRYLYPFTNCTNCGPRYSIIENLPYDRPNTSMKRFPMCPACQKEYEDPLDRRFHAQPNACPVCGPRLEFWDQKGTVFTRDLTAILQSVEALRRGAIIGVKGLGGFHLMVDARNEEAVSRLRERKHREEKPLALLYPSLKSVREHCEVSDLEERLLLSPESPIVLLSRLPSPQTGSPEGTDVDHQRSVAPSVAPRNPYLGIMLPYTPLHHILMHFLRSPVVATSGNLTDEPLCTDEHEALERLRGIADFFLVHNRPIVRHVDDSVARVLMGREILLRRSRGYAPLPLTIPETAGEPILALGAHLKNTVAFNIGTNIFISQHIGDLETPQALVAFRRTANDLQRLYATAPTQVVCDLHPDYVSTRHAQSFKARVTQIQHHYAHVAACIADNQLEGPALGVAWDGTGLGLDGTIWGGEFLLVDEISFRRVAHLRPFRLPGGEKAIKEPRRTAIGILYQIFGNQLFEQEHLELLKRFSESELGVLRQMLEQGTNAPLTSSAGRLFDAVAAILGLRHTVSFEGQAAMEVEYLIGQESTDHRYEFRVEPPRQKGAALIVDWSPTFFELILDVQRNLAGSVISAKFHNTLAEMIVLVAQDIKQSRVLLSGGCFQNKYLTERTVSRLRQEGFQPYWHQRVPPNDGGISTGQIYAFARQRHPVPQTGAHHVEALS